MIQCRQHRSVAAACGFAAMALAAWASIASGADEARSEQAASPGEDSGIPVRFSLEQPGYVTLVIEDAEGRRVKNLVSDQLFEAGDHAVYWDGYNEGVRQKREKHPEPKPLKHTRGRVEPGSYTLRGLVHDDIKLKYAARVQSPGSPPWQTENARGGWLADHTPPMEILFVPGGSPAGDEPQIVVGSPVGESGDPMVWLTENGEKLHGSKFSGWRAPSAMAIDGGGRAVERYYMYGLVNNLDYLELWGLVASPDEHATWKRGQYQRLHRISLPERLDRGDVPKMGLAVRNGVAAFSMPWANRVIFFDVRSEQVLAEVEVEDPRGMAIDDSGHLWMIRGALVYRYANVDWQAGKLGTGQAVVRQGLDDPRKIAFGPDGHLLASDWGQSNQVKVFDRRGRLIRRIGTPSAEIQLGRYDKTKMYHPSGITVDSRGRLWVAELNYAPKRISRWNLSTGEFDHAWYGPPRYGGGGELDPRDRTRFFYHSEDQGIAFRLDWERQTSEPIAIYSGAQTPGGAPSTPTYINGRLYLTNSFAGRPRALRCDSSIYLYDEAAGRAHIVGWAGTFRKGSFDTFLKRHAEDDPELARKLEEEIFVGWEKGRFTIWSDLNRDEKPQAGELQTCNLGRTPVMRDWPGTRFNKDLSIVTSAGACVPAPTFTDQGVPVWDLKQLTFFADMGRYFGGALQTRDGFFMITPSYVSPAPLVAYKDGRRIWEYHRISGPPGPRRPARRNENVLVFPTRALGYPFVPHAGEAGPVISLNSDRGDMYLLTSDGLYITGLGGDNRVAQSLTTIEHVEPGMILDDISFGGEHWWPSVTQMDDGAVYLCAGGPETAIFEVLGLGSVRRIGPWPVTVTPTQLAGRPEKLEILLEEQKAHPDMVVPIADKAPTLDGSLNDWPAEAWVRISDQENIDAAALVHSGTLYVAWRTGRPNLLDNEARSGWAYAFSTGGGLDVMIRADTRAEPPRRGRHGPNYHSAIKGDQRLFVTRLGDPRRGELLAALYHQVADQNASGESIVFDSPVGEVHFASVRQVSSDVKLAQQEGNFELAVPLAMFGLDASPGVKTLADLGVLIGSPAGTRARLYWANQNASNVDDLPSEARLLPQEWGTWRFQAGQVGDADAQGN